MRASSPPATVADMLDNQNAKRNRPFRRVRTNDILQEVEMLSSSFLSFVIDNSLYIYFLCLFNFSCRILTTNEKNKKSFLMIKKPN